MTTSLKTSLDSRLPGKITRAGCIFVCLAAFSTPLSTSLMGLFTALFVLSWFFSGTFLSLARTIRSVPATGISLLLFILLAVAISYSPDNLEKGLYVLKKYRELILLPIVVALLSSSKKYSKYAEQAFILGCVVLMCISYGMKAGIIPSAGKFGYSVVYHITHSLFMAILSFWMLHKSFASKQYRLLWIVLFLAAVINMFYIAPGRTGMFVFSVLMALFILQKFKLRNCIVAAIIVIGLFTAIYQSSDNFSRRTEAALSEIKNYQRGSSITSIGMRFDWWLTSIELIKKKPLTGHGTGSYEMVHKEQTKSTRIKQTNNPHNEYLFITVQTGLVGITLLLGLFACQFFRSMTLEDSERHILQGVIVAMMSGCLMNSFLLDSQPGHFFMFMSGALLASAHHSLPTRLSLKHR
ncbi:MAG: O-antigen ligase family protein [Desulfobulbaceae bacterium]|nr:MAG: O-antigen ligase family protein [Desulfobulbaceae bacterium]